MARIWASTPSHRARRRRRHRLALNSGLGQLAYLYTYMTLGMYVVTLVRSRPSSLILEFSRKLPRWQFKNALNSNRALEVFYFTAKHGNADAGRTDAVLAIRLRRGHFAEKYKSCVSLELSNGVLTVRGVAVSDHGVELRPVDVGEPVEHSVGDAEIARD